MRRSNTTSHRIFKWFFELLRSSHRQVKSTSFNIAICEANINKQPCRGLTTRKSLIAQERCPRTPVERAPLQVHAAKRKKTSHQPWERMDSVCSKGRYPFITYSVRNQGYCHTLQCEVPPSAVPFLGCAPVSFCVSSHIYRKNISGPTRVSTARCGASLHCGAKTYTRFLARAAHSGRAHCTTQHQSHKSFSLRLLSSRPRLPSRSFCRTPSSPHHVRIPRARSSASSLHHARIPATLTASLMLMALQKNIFATREGKQVATVAVFTLVHPPHSPFALQWPPTTLTFFAAREPTTVCLSLSIHPSFFQGLLEALHGRKCAGGTPPFTRRVPNPPRNQKVSGQLGGSCLPQLGAATLHFWSTVGKHATLHHTKSSIRVWLHQEQTPNTATATNNLSHCQASIEQHFVTL